MKYRFLKPSHPVLAKISKEIPQDQINSPGLHKIIKAMINIAYGEQKDKRKPVMVGLAAPQIGILKRIILVDIKADGKGPPATQAELARRCGRGKVGDLRIYLNPEIIWSSKGEQEWYEGCYSTGKICGIVSRCVSVKIRAIHYKTLGVNIIPPPRWDVVTEKWTGYTARIFQHEIDHLNGKVFISHIKDPEKLHWVQPEEFPLYRNEQAWRNWPKKASLLLAKKDRKKV